MSRIHVVAGLTAALALVLAAAASCGKGEAPQPASPPPVGGPPAETEAVKKLREQAEKATEEQRAALDKDARGLLASCDSRVYRPARDSALERAAGRIGVKSGGMEASFRFSFDVKNPSDKPVTFETISAPQGWDPAVTTDVRRWGVLACVSAYELVAYYRPPIQLGLQRDGDGNMIVVAPMFRTPLNVSYSLNSEQLIAIRGEWTDETNKFATNYEWERLSGLWLLRGSKQYKGPTTTFEYEHRGNLVLLRNVHVADRTPSVDAQFTFETIERRPN